MNNSPKDNSMNLDARGTSLVDAFDVGKGDFVAVIGAGGKSTLLKRLADELNERGMKVFTSSTTNLQPPRPGQTDDFTIANGAERMIELMQASFEKHQHVTAASSDFERKDKLKGLEPEELLAIHETRIADVILIQADGARKRSFKAPAKHEPTVPAFSTHCILTVGLDILGEPLDDRKVHRTEITAQFAGQPVGSIVTLETVLRVLEHPDAYLGRIPSSARRMLYLSKADSPGRLEAAQCLADLISPESYSPVIWADLK